MHFDRVTIRALAPARLKNVRRFRYRGDDQTIPLGAFTVEEQSTLHALYTFLHVLEAAATTLPALDTFLRTASLGELTVRVAAIGSGRRLEPNVAATAHDLRSGILSALLLELAFDSAERMPPANIRVLAHDCSKQMRNLVADIDPPARASDLLLRFHSIKELSAALRDYHGSDDASPVTLTLDSDDDVVIAASCAELGAIERALFILLGNAARHASDRKVAVTLAGLDADLRIVVMNALTERSREDTHASLAKDPAVFYSDFSSTGSGLGLQTVAALVGRAYGIDTTSELVAGGHIGTAIEQAVFASWMHWPLAEASGDADCACR